MVWVRLNGFWNSVGFGSLAGRARQTLGSSQTLNSVSCDLQSPLGRCFDDSAASTLRLHREACEKAQKFRLQRSGVGVALRLLRAGTDTGSATETPESSNQSEMPRQHAKTLTKLLGSPAGANSRPPPIAASRRSGPFRTSKQPCGTAEPAGIAGSGNSDVAFRPTTSTMFFKPRRGGGAPENMGHAWDMGHAWNQHLPCSG